MDCLNVTLQQLLLVNGGKRSKTGRRKNISKNKGDDVKKTSKKHGHDDDDEDDVLWRETVWSLKFRQTSPHPEIVSESTTSTPLSDLSPFLQPPARHTGNTGNSLARRTNQKGDQTQLPCVVWCVGHWSLIIISLIVYQFANTNTNTKSNSKTNSNTNTNGIFLFVGQCIMSSVICHDLTALATNASSRKLSQFSGPARLKGGKSSGKNVEDHERNPERPDTLTRHLKPGQHTRPHQGKLNLRIFSPLD